MLTENTIRAYTTAIMRQRIYPDLATFLEETGTTQQELARKVRLSQPKISRIVNGLQQPTLPQALRIVRFARVPIESLVTREDVMCVE